MKLTSSPLSMRNRRSLQEEHNRTHDARLRALSDPMYARFIQPGALFLLPEAMQGEAVRRLVILVPSEGFSVSELITKIGGYAVPGTSLLFVARGTDPDQELMIRRRLILLENLVRSPTLQVHSQLITDRSWMKIAADIRRKGDVFVCLGEHKVRKNLFGSTFLGMKIYFDLQVPVLIHQDFHVSHQFPYQKMVREFIAYALFILTILVFFYLQIQIDHAVFGWLNRVLLILTIFVEFYLILKINDIFS